MADDVGNLDDELLAAEQLGVQAQGVAHEDDVEHARLEGVAVAARLRVEGDPLRSDGERAARVVRPDGDRIRFDGLVGDLHPTSVLAPIFDPSVEQVVLSDEAGHEAAFRFFVQSFRSGDLLDAALVHDRDPVGENHRFALVVGDVEHGHPEALLEAADFVLHLLAQAAVQRPERLVHEHQVGLEHERPGDRDALLLAAGQLPGAARLEALQLDHVQGAFDAGFDLVFGQAARVQGKGEVLGNRHVGEQGVVLEDQPDVALVGLDRGHGPAVQPDIPAVGVLEAGQHLEAGGFAGTGRPEQRDELAARDLQIEILHRQGAAVVALVHPAEFDEGGVGSGFRHDVGGTNRAHDSRRGFRLYSWRRGKCLD